MVLAEKDARLAEKDVRLAEHAKVFASELARAKHDADVARGVVDARGLLEACIAELWALVASDPTVRMPASQKLARLLGSDGKPPASPALVAYLQQAAVDNGVPVETLMTQARKLYDVFSERLHTESASGDGTTRLPSDLFERSGRATMVALTAFVRFTGRTLELYDVDGAADELHLRDPLPTTAPPSAAAT